MRIISLWNGDYLKSIGTYQSMIGSVMIPYNSEEAFSNIVIPASAQHLSVLRTVNGTGRYGLNLKPSGTNSTDMSIFLMFPSIADLDGFKTAGVKKHYIGVRVIANNVNTTGGGKILHFGSSATAYFAPINGQEVFVEIVTDLTTNYRVVYVNGEAYTNSSSIPDAAQNIHIGNYDSSINKLLATTQHNFDLMDMYVAVAETDEDALVKRLGKMHIKTATLDTVTNDAKFTPVPKDYDTIPKILTMVRSNTGSTNIHVLTDSNQSKMGLHWQKPTDGTEVLGASLQIAAMKPPAAQSKTVVTRNGVDRMLKVYDDTATWLAYQPVSIPTPEGGWSEDAIANLDIKIGSERTL